MKNYQFVPNVLNALALEMVMSWYLVIFCVHGYVALQTDCCILVILDVAHRAIPFSWIVFEHINLLLP